MTPVYHKFFGADGILTYLPMENMIDFDQSLSEESGYLFTASWNIDVAYLHMYPAHIEAQPGSTLSRGPHAPRVVV